MPTERYTHFGLHFPQLLLFTHIFVGLANVNAGIEKEFYIVLAREQPVNEESVLASHLNILSVLKGSYVEAKESLVYSYSKSFNAFAARLYEDEAEELSGMDEVISVFKNRYHKFHTTKSWDFIGLPSTAKRKLETESNIIVGLLDTGITPQSLSFGDKGFGPPPAKWKGTCGRFANFSGCNNKLIGARYFKLDGIHDPSDILSPVDVDGHGTHTSSTLAGNVIPNASLFGLASGTARGAVPSARVAMYKVCWVSSGCADMDLLAAFDMAVKDGVDVISISIGGLSENYTTDSIAIGAFHAMRKGIITVASAGNDGPRLGSVMNHAPWILTVGASGIDRQFRSRVVLGNGKTISGIGVNILDTKEKSYPLVSGVGVAKNSESMDTARYCYQESLDPQKVKGKLVLCKLAMWGIDSVVKGLGGVGTLVQSDSFLDTAQIFMAPATMVSSSDSDSLGIYMNSTRSPSAMIYKSEEVKIQAPFVASFSSRGPNPASKHLLKPDIAAPGIDILASYTPLKSLTGLKGDNLFSKFTLMSGTSMACPHVAGAAAYVKSFRPNWSPAMIKSALMTTAMPMSSRVNTDAEFAYGSGQLNPRKAVNPGLVYDMDELSYFQFLCREKYSGSSIASLIGSKPINCSSLIPGLGSDALNYPSMQFAPRSNHESTTGVFRRTVTNVGQDQSVYNVTVRAPRGVEMTVKPLSLVFERAGQTRAFKVVVKANPMKSGQMVSGSVIWKSTRHVVRSPIVIYSPDI